MRWAESHIGEEMNNSRSAPSNDPTQTLDIVVVTVADLDAARGEAVRLGRITHRHRHLRGRQPVQQALNNQAAKLSGGSRNDDHELLLTRVQTGMAVEQARPQRWR